MAYHVFGLASSGPCPTSFAPLFSATLCLFRSKFTHVSFHFSSFHSLMRELPHYFLSQTAAQFQVVPRHFFSLIYLVTRMAWPTTVSPLHYFFFPLLFKPKKTRIPPHVLLLHLPPSSSRHNQCVPIISLPSYLFFHHHIIKPMVTSIGQDFSLGSTEAIERDLWRLCFFRGGGRVYWS